MTGPVNDSRGNAGGGAALSGRSLLVLEANMPFDGVATPFNFLTKFDQVIDLIEAPNRWIKHSYNTPWGGYCLKEALNVVGIAETFEPVILKAAEEVMEREFCCVESFNDHPLTTHGDVIAVLRRARENFLSGKIGLPERAASRPVFAAAGSRGWLPAFWQKMFA
jgi:hypothetical protein